MLELGMTEAFFSAVIVAALDEDGDAALDSMVDIIAAYLLETANDYEGFKRPELEVDEDEETALSSELEDLLHRQGVAEALEQAINYLLYVSIRYLLQKTARKPEQPRAFQQEISEDGAFLKLVDILQAEDRSRRTRWWHEGCEHI